MNYKDKRGIIPTLKNREKVIVELGCGAHKSFPDSVGIDIMDSEAADIVCDLNEGLGFLEDESVDLICSYHFLEHIREFGFLMKEISRVLKKGGTLTGTVPHFSNPYYYSDYTHKTPFGLYSFCYFAKETPFRRKVLKYDPEINFRIKSIKIIFYSPFRIVNLFRKVHGLIFNLSTGMQEFYEGSLSRHFPAHELSFELEKA